MKKLIAIILALTLLICGGVSEETTDAPLQAGENEILLHGYISPYKNYYIGVPAEWAILGAGSNDVNLTEATEMLEDVNVYGFARQMTADNDVLLCMAEEAKAGLIVNYGPCSGVTNDRLIKSLDEIEAAIKAACPGITFKEESGSVEFKSVAEILLISMNYKNRDILQYYVVNGSDLYLFTFFGTSRTIAETVLTTFTIQ